MTQILKCETRNTCGGYVPKIHETLSIIFYVVH